jgi:hypothetical protein
MSLLADVDQSGKNNKLNVIFPKINKLSVKNQKILGSNLKRDTLILVLHHLNGWKACSISQRAEILVGYTVPP